MCELIERVYPEERIAFTKALDPDLAALGDDEVRGSGYVLDTLTSSVWCCLRAGSFEEAALAAVNLGEDTDTTGAVTGGLAGLVFGLEAIPHDWLATLIRRDDIVALCDRFQRACPDNWRSTA